MFAVLPVTNFWLSQFGLALRLNVCLFALAVVEKTWLTNTVEYLCEETTWLTNANQENAGIT